MVVTSYGILPGGASHIGTPTNAGGKGMAMNPEVNVGKVFIGGLAPQTGDADLKNIFSQYGEVQEATVMTVVDYTGPVPRTRSRGFGFVVFKSPDSVESVVGIEGLMIHGKTVEVKRVDENKNRDIEEGRKIFVGGVPPEVTSEELRNYFIKYDPDIGEVRVMSRPDSNLSRGFAYVTFSSPEVVKTIMATKQEHHVGGKWVEVKECLPQSATLKKGKGKFGEKGKGGVGKGDAYHAIYDDPWYSLYGSSPYRAAIAAAYAAGAAASSPSTAAPATYSGYSGYLGGAAATSSPSTASATTTSLYAAARPPATSYASLYAAYPSYAATAAGGLDAYYAQYYAAAAAAAAGKAPTTTSEYVTSYYAPSGKGAAAAAYAAAAARAKPY